MTNKDAALKSKRRQILDLEDTDESEAWLVSYADLMTLVACFFILLMVFANYEDPKFFPEAPQKTKEKGGFQSVLKKTLTTKAKELSKDQTVKFPRVQVIDQIKKGKSSLDVVFRGNFLFEKDTYLLRSSSKQKLRETLESIFMINKNYRIIIEGHADSNEKLQNINSWELSALRAAKVASLAKNVGFSEKSIAALSFGNTRPVEKEIKGQDPLKLNNRHLNRRITIKVLEPLKALEIGYGRVFNPNEQVLDSKDVLEEYEPNQ